MNDSMDMKQENHMVMLGLIQNAVSEDPADNMEKTSERIKEAAGRGARIICLQELYRTRYFPQEESRKVDHLAESIPGDSTQTFAPLAKKLGVVVIVPLFERAPDGCFYNSAVVIDADGTLLPTYRKVHIPHDPLFYEQSYFAAGNLGYRVYRTRYASFAVLICYDQWFPEAARICTLQGAEIIFYPTAIGRIHDHIPDDGDWENAWETVQRGHAIANGVHVAAVNRVGEEGRLQFFGGSFVCDAFGRVLRKAGSHKEEILIVDADLSQNQRIREGWGFIRNRRPETYGDISR